MSEQYFNITSIGKIERYQQFLEQVRPCIEGETYEVSLLANVSAALKEVFDFFWVGFYLERQGELRLGPFQGTVACMHIANGKGVCGTAWERRQTIVVPDVEAFPGHIACSSASRSEIVVPLLREGEVLGVLDIDSRELATFDEADVAGLEPIAALLISTSFRN